MSPALNGSFALQCFERGITVELCNGMFDFYLGLPHRLLTIALCVAGVDEIEDATPTSPMQQPFKTECKQLVNSLTRVRILKLY